MVNGVSMCLLDCLILIVYLVSTHTPEHEQNVQVKYLANLLAFVYKFYSSNYNSYELAEGYGWKEFYILCYPILSYMFARGLAKVKCGGI